MAERPPAATLTDERIPFDSGWELLRIDAGAISTPEELPDDSGLWSRAVVPGTVASALGVARASVSIDAHDWWYRRRFTWERDHGRVSIVLGGLATIADVWLNGVPLLHSENMFVHHECDVTTLLRADNELVICFASIDAALRVKRPRPRWRSKLTDTQGLRWLRTTLLGHIPAWPGVPSATGPWREIELVRHGVVSVTDLRLRPGHNGEAGVLDATVCIRVDGATHISKARILCGSVTGAMSIARSGDAVTLHAILSVPDAPIWWPHTHGEQPLHDVVVRVESDLGIIDLPLGRVGFRTVELDTSDGNFGFRVNGKAVFCRGACWSTVDPVALGGTRDEYLSALTLARDAGMNMLRVGGTMVYEANAFYELCDELGILVWQDLMFANMDYPGDDARFAASVTQEVTQLLGRLGSHPSLALICGNSEVEQQAAMLGLPRESWSGPLFSDLIPSLVADRCPGLAYWPSSPSGGVFPFHVNAGDAHYFGFGPYLRPASDVRGSGVRFASECLALANVPEPAMVDSLSCGSAGAGHHPAWKLGVPRDNGAGWDFEDVRDHYVASLFKTDTVAERYADPERYLALGRAAGGEMIARTVGEWRRADSGCNGALVWFYRDLVPGAGWGLLDATGTPKAAYYYFRRASLPVAIFTTDEGLNGIAVHVANDTPEVLDVEVRVALYRAGNAMVGDGARRLKIAGGTTIMLSAGELLAGFADINYAYRFGPPSHDVVVATLTSARTGSLIGDAFHFPLGMAAITAPLNVSAIARPLGDGSYALKLRSDTVATAVAIQVSGFRPDDNYFHLQPDTERSVTIRPVGLATRLSGHVTPLNAAGSSRIEVQ
ncbi:MAG: glycoside hydrolase family 2 protein [Gemmatimonadaceae bacterium]